MRKGVVFLFFIFVLTGCSFTGHATLEEAVQSRWDTPIKVVNQDSEKHLVYYLDYDQHVIGTYEFRDGKYFYDNKQSEGMRFTSASGLPFYIQYKYFEGSGDIVYGGITTEDYQVEKFVIHYKSGEIQEINAENNTFMSEIPPNVDPRDIMSQIDIVYGYDKNGEVIESMDY